MCEGAREQAVKIISAEELELNCLEMIDLVAERGFTYVITKNGEPIAMMKPVPPEPDPVDTSGGAGTFEVG
jgi:antitoxin (DNA-binding transcriptional repressor) of toxin-antitoxin stability system